MSVTGPEKRRISTRLETLDEVPGQFHTVNKMYAGDGQCPACDTRGELVKAAGNLERAYIQCRACGCVVERATGRALYPASDEPPPGTSTGALGEPVQEYDVPLSRKPRV